MQNTFQMLINQLSDPALKTKVAARFGGFVRDRLRESSFVEQVLPPENVDAAQCQVSVNHDSLVKIVSLEPRSRASVVNFRGEPRANFIRGLRVECAFFTIMSDMFQKPEQELLAYDFPITKVVEDNSVKDIGEIQDREFLIHAESGVQALQVEANGGSATALHNATIGSTVEFSVTKGEFARTTGAADTALSLPVQRPDLVRLMKLLNGNRLQCAMFLMSEVDYNDILQWTIEDQGMAIQSETLVHGIKFNTLLGMRFIRTIKTDILRPGNVYAFTAPEFLGRFYILNQTKFYIDKVINMIKFVAWKDVGMLIANIASVRKLELYAGDASGADADSILADVTPKAEADLGAVNNRASAGQYYPSVVQF